MNLFSGPHYPVGSADIFVSAKVEGNERWCEDRYITQKKKEENFLDLLSYMKKYNGELTAVHEKSQKYSVFISCQLAIFLSVLIQPYEQFVYSSISLHTSTPKQVKVKARGKEILIMTIRAEFQN